MKVNFKIFLDGIPPIELTLDVPNPPATHDNVWMFADMLGDPIKTQFPAKTEFLFVCTNVEWHYTHKDADTYNAHATVRLRGVG